MKNLILTKNKGLVEIASVVEGDEVYDATGLPRKVKAQEEIVSKKLILSTQHSFGEVVVGENFKVLGVQRKILREGKNYKQLEPFVHAPVLISALDLKAGDLLFLKTPSYDVKTFEPLDLAPKEEGRYRILQREVVEKKPFSTSDKTRFKRFFPFDIESLWVLGRFISCGWVEFDVNKKPEALAFGFEAGERENLKKVQEFFLGLSMEPREKRFNKQGQIKLVVDNKLLAKAFCELFPLHKHVDATKYLGDFKKLPKEELRSLLLGLFSTDDLLQTSSEALVLDVREALMYLGVPSKITEKKEIHRKNLDRPRSFVLKFKDLEGETEDKLQQDDGYYVRLQKIEPQEEGSVLILSLEEGTSYSTSNVIIEPRK